MVTLFASNKEDAAKDAKYHRNSQDKLSLLMDNSRLDIRESTSSVTKKQAE